MSEVINILNNDENNSILIECRDKIVKVGSLVRVSEYDHIKGIWYNGANQIMTMQEALSLKIPIVTKDSNMTQFMRRTHKPKIEKNKVVQKIE